MDVAEREGEAAWARPTAASIGSLYHVPGESGEDERVLEAAASGERIEREAFQIFERDAVVVNLNFAIRYVYAPPGALPRKHLATAASVGRALCKIRGPPSRDDVLLCHHDRSSIVASDSGTLAARSAWIQNC